MGFLFSLLPWLLLLLALPLLLRRRPRLEAYPERGGEDAPLVSVVVPARNEALNVGGCLATLLASSYPRFEVILVDDHSEDGTGEIGRALAERARAGQLRVLEAAPLPPGWLGKPWACWQGYQAARGELLLFTDADTRHDADVLGRSVAALEAERADLVSLLPRQILGSFWERAVMPQVGMTLAMRYPDASAVNRAEDVRDAIANGQYVLTRREPYEAIGGHAAVRDEVVEDLRLAQLYVAAGRRLFLVHAEDRLEVRMYHSLAGIIEGWSKNLARGSRLSVDPWLRPALPWLIAAFLLLAWVVPPAALVISVVGLMGGLFAWSAAATGLSLLFWTGVYAHQRIPLSHAFAYPIGAAVTAWLFARSALRADRVEWKGRAYRRGDGETERAEADRAEADSASPDRARANRTDPD